MTEVVINKLTPCGCGCQGQDPWHKASYRRTVTKISETEGTVKLPFSTQPVRVTRRFLGVGEKSGKPLYGVWMVDRASINFDK